MAEGNELYPFDWETLVPRLVHPLKVAILEALTYIAEPLSATDLQKLFFREKDKLSLISYHLVALAKAEAVVKVRQRQRRGTVENFYFFPR